MCIELDEIQFTLRASLEIFNPGGSLFSPLD